MLRATARVCAAHRCVHSERAAAWPLLRHAGGRVARVVCAGCYGGDLYRVPAQGHAAAWARRAIHHGIAAVSHSHVEICRAATGGSWQDLSAPRRQADPHDLDCTLGAHSGAADQRRAAADRAERAGSDRPSDRTRDRAARFRLAYRRRPRVIAGGARGDHRYAGHDLRRFRHLGNVNGTAEHVAEYVDVRWRDRVARVLRVCIAMHVDDCSDAEGDGRLEMAPCCSSGTCWYWRISGHWRRTRSSDPGYSRRNASFGSMRAPRIAGIALAIIATSSNTPVTNPNTAGSRAD